MRNLLTCLPIFFYSILQIKLEEVEIKLDSSSSLGIIGIEDFDVAMKSNTALKSFKLFLKDYSDRVDFNNEGSRKSSR